MRESGGKLLRPLLNRLLRLLRLPSHVVGNIRQVSFIRPNSRKVVQLSDQLLRAQRLPDLFRPRFDHCDLSAGRNIRSCPRHRSNASGNRGANLNHSL